MCVASAMLTSAFDFMIACSWGVGFSRRGRRGAEAAIVSGPGNSAGRNERSPTALAASPDDAAGWLMTVTEMATAIVQAPAAANQENRQSAGSGSLAIRNRTRARNC